MLSVSANDNPVSTSDNGNITIRNVGFATTNQALEISLADGKVANIEKSDGLVEWVCLPPLVDKHAMDKLNHRPRKTLGYRTPYEVFFNTKTSLTVALGS